MYTCLNLPSTRITKRVLSQQRTEDKCCPAVLCGNCTREAYNAAPPCLHNQLTQQLIHRKKLAQRPSCNPLSYFTFPEAVKVSLRMEKGLGGKHFKECNGRQPRETDTGCASRSAQHQASQTQQGWAGHHEVLPITEKLQQLMATGEGEESVFIRDVATTGSPQSSRWSHTHAHQQH